MKALFAILCFTCLGAFAQPQFTRLDTIKVSSFGNLLKNPWTGGLNFTEWSAIDLDMDGHKDLAVFDKSGEIVRFFLNDGIAGTTSFTHAPHYQTYLPGAISSWVLFYDYNNDGREDLFTYALGYGGIRVYTNNSTPGNIQFTYLKNYLLSDYPDDGSPPVNTPVNSVAVPGLGDIDQDGDLDVITFAAGSGILLEYHQNNSMELYGNADSLNFVVADRCWGNAAENNCTPALDYSVCTTNRLFLRDSIKKLKESNPDKTLHSGSCMLCIDMEGDNDIDLVLGDISCDSIEYFGNDGSVGSDHFGSTTKIFPNSSNSITFDQFPCSYYVDVDNDGKRDLIAAPNIQASENYQSVWFYKNIGQDNNPNFQFVKKNFFQDQMLDFGEGAFPAVLDFDSDGDMDIIVGNFGYYTPISVYHSRLALLQNTGSNTHPRFNLINDDYLGLSAKSWHNIAPTTGDLDGDGDMDLLIGDASGRMTYFQNTAPIGSSANFVQVSDYTTGFCSGIDVGINAYPHIFDVNNDGLKDIVIGEYEGWLNYMENIGTSTTPSFASLVTPFGNVRTIQTGYYEGQSVPFFFRENGVTKAFVGSERGWLYLFGNIDGNLSGNFSLLDSIYGGIKEGENIAPCLYDFNNDGFKDMIIGNYSGGIAYYNGSLNTNSINKNIELISEIDLYPNPANETVSLKFNNYNLGKKHLIIYDAIGRKIMEQDFSDNLKTIDISNLQAGVYIIECSIAVANSNKSIRCSKRLIKQ